MATRDSAKRKYRSSRSRFRRKKTLTIFISYAHTDREFLHDLVKQLRLLQRRCPAITNIWWDEKLNGGDAWHEKIIEQVEQADLILPLLSPDFEVSSYCQETEMACARSREFAGECLLVPIIIRDLPATEYSAYQMLPEGGKPIKHWSDRDSAYKSVILGLQKVITENFKVKIEGGELVPEHESTSKNAKTTRTKQQVPPRSDARKTKRVLSFRRLLLLAFVVGFFWAMYSASPNEDSDWNSSSAGEKRAEFFASTQLDEPTPYVPPESTDAERFHADSYEQATRTIEQLLSDFVDSGCSEEEFEDVFIQGFQSEAGLDSKDPTVWINVSAEQLDASTYQTLGFNVDSYQHRDGVSKPTITARFVSSYEYRRMMTAIAAGKCWVIKASIVKGDRKVALSSCRVVSSFSCQGD